MNLARLTWQAALAGRWTARIVGSLMVLFILTFVFGEGPPPLLRMTTREQLYALGMASLFLGLVVAWFREGWGGLISLLGWAFLAVLARRPAGDLPFSIPAAAGLLHLLCWWRLRGPAPPREAANWATGPHVRTLILLLSISLGIFVLLSANEIFGQPPLMTAAGPLPAEMVGTWSANLTRVSRQPLPDEILVVLNIGPDGSVSGTVGNARLTSGQLLPNRSWFGRLMNWRAPYEIRGALSQEVRAYGGTVGDRFTAGLDMKGSELRGALFLSHPGVPKPLGLSLTKQ
ncbi:MAG TPA: hypothetical protein VGZ73_27820 [Bryobacteraceae bacterium]|jgi:hypothetical protein|nr:hypothetical protein [Bryobacteraceae bacterium]